ncbi:GNAT family N-acetyltransferase [Haloarchaeobius baliensis]|uniref:GNAT family N-acetyltransferase n=1 Tax=Haloarchaeobius baliensis TaxID=1670458 RepID=UPI003F8838BB
MNVEPVTLHGDYVRLEPLSAEDHLDDLIAAGDDEDIFRWFGTQHAGPEAMRSFVADAMEAQAEGDQLPFATVRQDTDEAIGSTRFGNIRHENRSVEIGWTWLTPDEQRTPANTEAKLLQLRHAFERWDCVRVEFETAAANEPARGALSRIGAVEEGILRKHMVVQGEPQDSAFYSILDTEWPDVEQDLAARLAQ